MQVAKRKEHDKSRSKPAAYIPESAKHAANAYRNSMVHVRHCPHHPENARGRTESGLHTRDCPHHPANAHVNPCKPHEANVRYHTTTTTTRHETYSGPQFAYGPPLPVSRVPENERASQFGGAPSHASSRRPSHAPSHAPSRHPSHASSRAPTRAPTCAPSHAPSRGSSRPPSGAPGQYFYSERETLAWNRDSFAGYVCCIQ
ncbi:hypothetical protein BJX76DRAFT_341303 [Aspergillus varians]